MKDGSSPHPAEEAVFSILEDGFEALGLLGRNSAVSDLTRLTLLLSQWAGRINLTGHRSPEAIASRLVLDALAMANAIPELGAADSLADLGSGAGFPGLPIAVLFRDLRVFLVDSRLKRHHFRREACRHLSLDNATSVLGRTDEVEATPCDIVMAQAMTTPREALAFMLDWAKPEALLVLPASAASERPSCPTGVGSLEMREYVVPETRALRKLWVARPESL